jgi:hypothetical protein
MELISAFAGPALLGELALVCRSSFDTLKDRRSLKESLALVGWEEEVLESLGKSWLSKMAMVEELWTVEPSFSTPT